MLRRLGRTPPSRAVKRIGSEQLIRRHAVRVLASGVRWGLVSQLTCPALGQAEVELVSRGCSNLLRWAELDGKALHRLLDRLLDRLLGRLLDRLLDRLMDRLLDRLLGRLLDCCWTWRLVGGLRLMGGTTLLDGLTTAVGRTLARLRSTAILWVRAQGAKAKQRVKWRASEGLWKEHVDAGLHRRQLREVNAKFT